jgi:hypothetical protein
MGTASNSFTKFFLPSYFKIIGLVLIIISILVLVFAALVKSYVDFFPAARQLLMCNRLSLVFGLSLIIFSKEKTENEETQELRFNAFVFSLGASVLILIVFEVINIFNNQVPLNAVDFLVIEMCAYYIFFKIQNYF